MRAQCEQVECIHIFEGTIARLRTIFPRTPPAAQHLTHSCPSSALHLRLGNNGRSSRGGAVTSVLQQVHVCKERLAFSLVYHDCAEPNTSDSGDGRADGGDDRRRSHIIISCTARCGDRHGDRLRGEENVLLPTDKTADLCSSSGSGSFSGSARSCAPLCTSNLAALCPAG